jgi:hypothetical protein
MPTIAKPARERAASSARVQPAPDLSGDRWRKAYDIICEVYRLALHNAFYNGNRLSRVSRQERLLEVVVAVLAAAVAGLALLKLPQDLWWPKVLALTAAVVAVLKPALQLNKSVSTYAARHAAYTDVYLAYKELVSRIQLDGRVTVETWHTHEVLNKRYHVLELDSDPDPPPKVQQALRAAVQKVIPVESLRIE